MWSGIAVTAEYWNRIIEHMNRTLSKGLQLSPMECLLGVVKKLPKHKTGNRLMDLALGGSQEKYSPILEKPNGAHICHLGCRNRMLDQSRR